MAYAATTKVPVAQTRGEIETLLARHKAQAFGTATDYEQRAARVQFKANDRHVRFVVTLPDPSKFGRDGIRYAQEERRIWRALLLVIKAKLESVESGIATFEDEFLAQIVMPNDQTVGQLMKPVIERSYKSGRLELGPKPEASK